VVMKATDKSKHINSRQVLAELEKVLKTPNHKDAEKLHNQIGYLTPEDLLRRFNI